MAAATSAKYGATTSARVLPATKPAIRERSYGPSDMAWTEPRT